MATAAAAPRRDVKEFSYVWEGRDKTGKTVRGEMRASGETVVTSQPAPPGHPRHQDQAAPFRGGKKLSEKDITFFTRQLATMLKAGVPLLQSFDIVGKGHCNPRFSRC